MADDDTQVQKGDFSGTDRAAILLLTLGEEDAAAVLQHMGPKEVQRVGTSMARLNNVSREQVEAVLARFIEAAGQYTALGVDSDSYIRNVLVKALGEEKAGGVIDRILLGANTKGLDALKWMDPRAVADIIRLEHPQIIAIVLAYLEADQAAEVLALLPERIQHDVLLRIATLDGLNPMALQELNEILERQFSGKANVKSSNVGGVKTAANILNFLESAREALIMEQIQEVDGDLAQKIQDLMFVFENLADLDDRGIQALLREVSSEDLILALRGSDEALKEKFFGNMSKRAAEMLRDDLEARGPVRLSDVEAAQKEILAIARRMAEAGEVNLGGRGGEEYV
jgi:flagellar motor switch protein FliG